MNWEELRDKVFEFAFNEALNDATRRTGAASKKVEFVAVENEKVYGEVKGLIKGYVDAIIEKQELWDFYEVEEKVEKCLKEHGFNEFTFGNIQKLINMTMKYLYIACYSDKELRKRFNQCHCPMDRIMKDKVVKMYKECKDVDEEIVTITIGGETTKDWSKVSWSKITQDNPDAYKKFQEMVKYLAGKYNISPLEFDFKEFKRTN